MATRKKPGNKPFANLQDHPVAVIGLEALFPDAPDLSTYWKNIYDEVDSIVDIPINRWSMDEYYDPDPNAPDRSYSKRGGFIPDVPFNPMEFGLPPNILDVTDVSQLLALVIAKRALTDAGYLDAVPEILERTGVTLGMVGMASKVATGLSARLQFPIWRRALKNVGITDEEAEHVIEKIQSAYIEWNENAFPGALGNIVAGRITNRFDLGATNCTLDAACASSLAAIHMAISELISGRADMMLTGGVDLDNSMLTYLCFSKTPALTTGEKVRTFDESTSGMLPGEGIGMMVLKRLADAEQDGDRIYAVIRGVGSSSDGRYKSIYAPRPEGQARAVRRAYDEAGYDPDTVGLIEAHGTGTPAGDPAEVEALKMVFTNEKNGSPSIALGSVKSQIGHTKAAAGAAGMIKAILALHHKVLPATLNVESVSPKLELDSSLFYVNSENRPWFRKSGDIPRRASVSAFGFGGTNFHIAIEEYQASHTDRYRLIQGAKMVLLHEPSSAQLALRIKSLLNSLDTTSAEFELVQLAQQTETAVVPTSHARIAFVAEDAAGFIKELTTCLDFLEKSQDVASWEHPRGIFYRKEGVETNGKVVGLFPGQGSQTVNMGKELAMMYPPVQSLFSEMDQLRKKNGLDSVTSTLYPIPVFSEEDRKNQQKELTLTENAQPAIGTLSAAMCGLLTDAGLALDFVAGHSFGELTALWAGGALSTPDFLQLTIDRGQAMKANPDKEAGTMLAVKGDADEIISAVESLEDVTVANINSHQQVVLAGTVQGIGKAQIALANAGFATIPLSVSAAFHSKLVAHAQEPFAKAIRQKTFSAPHTPVFSNNTTQAYKENVQDIQNCLENHILGTVDFRKEIENLYAAGGRIFIEIGPRNTLSKMVDNILEGKDFYTISLNSNHRANADTQLRLAYLQLKVLGLPLSILDQWVRWPAIAGNASKPKMQVMLNGGIYHSDAMIKRHEAVMNDGYQIERNVGAMVVDTERKPDTEQAMAQPTGGDQNLQLNAYSAAIHEEYLKAAQEFNRALAVMTQMEQDLVRLGNQNGTYKHLEAVIERISRLMSHQEAILGIHASVLQQGPVPNYSAAPVRPVVQPVPVSHPQMIAPAPVAIAETITQQPPMPEPVVVPAVVKAEEPVASPSVTPSSEVSSGTSVDQLLLRVVSEKTGYPEETLELEMNMEADLGIDSIKRVEILGAMQDELPDIDEIDMEELSSLATLQDVAQFLANQVADLPSKKA